MAEPVWGQGQVRIEAPMTPSILPFNMRFSAELRRGAAQGPP